MSAPRALSATAATLADTQQNIAILLYRVDELTKALAETTSEMQCEFKDIRSALKGNGRPGIEQRTREVEHQIRMLADIINKQNDTIDKHSAEHSTERERIEQERRDMEKERRDTVNKIVVAVIGMIIANVGTIITAVILYRLGL